MKKNLGNLMIDIETFSNRSGAALISLAAVEFNIKNGEIGRRFYEKCTLQSNLDVGLEVNGGSIIWWMNQPDDVRKEVLSGKQHISKMLNDFTLFIEDIGTSNLQIWGNSNRFDLGILEDAYNAVKKKIPWKYTMERDVRTLVSFYPVIKKEEEFVGTKHNPLDDCLHQIKYCVKIWKIIMN